MSRSEGAQGASEKPTPQEQVGGKQVDTSSAESGFICNVGYDSTNYWFKSRGYCAVCEEQGTIIHQCGWVGTIHLHQSKACRGYFETSDEYLMWKERATPKTFNAILDEYRQAKELWKGAEDKTGRKCAKCGTTRGIGYYGAVDDMSCFCKPCHRKWINGPGWESWVNGEADDPVTDLVATDRADSTDVSNPPKEESNP